MSCKVSMGGVRHLLRGVHCALDRSGDGPSPWLSKWR